MTQLISFLLVLSYFPNICQLSIIKPRHEISNNVVCAISKGSDQSDQSLCCPFEYFMSVKLLTEHHLELLSLKEGCTDSSEYTLVKMAHC